MKAWEAGAQTGCRIEKISGKIGVFFYFLFFTYLIFGVSKRVVAIFLPENIEKVAEDAFSGCCPDLFADSLPTLDCWILDHRAGFSFLNFHFHY